VISGSYWPGDIHWFRGAGEGRYEKGQVLKQPNGKHVNAGGEWQNERNPDMDSLAASPWLRDVDDDGDLDLLVGNIAGNLILIENEGDAKKPSFGDRRSRVQAGGKDLNCGNNDTGPTTADWDGDGLWDLIVGSGDGSVTFFKNTGTKKEMEFAAGIQLISPNESHAIKHDQQPTRACARTKVHVCDWNLDGRLDLLVGDFTSVEMPEPKLTEAQTKKRDELQKKQQELGQQMGKLFEAQRKDGELKGELKEEMEKVSKEYSDLYQELRPLQAEHKAAGWVWVYLQQKPVSKQ
jgi:hypothetical protein